MEAHAAQLLAERRRQFLDEYTDVALPERDQAILLALLGAPGGTSTRWAAEAIGCSHMTVSRQFNRWRHDGAAEVRGRGSGRRWYLTHVPLPGRQADGSPRTPLHAVSPPDEAAAGDAQ